MPKSYRAILKKGRIRWIDEVPDELEKEELHVRVTIQQEEVSDNGSDLASLLDELAEEDPFAGIDDPVDWQRELRRDRAISD